MKKSGHDGITDEILKCCSQLIEAYLAETFDNCFNGEVFPSQNCKSYSSIQKRQSQRSGYSRPISLLSSLSKVFETRLYKRMMAFCTTNELLTPVQHGLRPKLFCTHAILSITEFLRQAIE